MLDAGAAVFALVCLARLAAELPARATENDFAHYYASSRLLLEGRDPYTTSLVAPFARYGFVYEPGVPAETNPPPLVWLFVPLALLPARAAFWFWVALEAAGLAAVLCLTRRLLGDRLSPRGWYFVCVLALTSAAVYWHFYFSQVQLLLAALVLAAYRWAETGRPIRACVAVTLGGLLKLFPLVLLPWFIWGAGNGPRAWKKRLAASACVAAGGVAFTGLGLWKDFCRFGLKIVSADAINHTFNFTLPALVTNLGLAARGFDVSVGPSRGWSLAALACGLGLIGLTYLWCLRSGEDRERQFCVLSVAMLAGSVTAWGHYFVFLIFPMTVAAVRLAVRPTVGRVFFFGLLLWALNFLRTVESPFLDAHLCAKVLVNNIPLGGLIGLGVFLMGEPGADGARADRIDPG